MNVTPRKTMSASAALAAAVGLALLAPAAAWPQQAAKAAPKKMPLSALDYIEIKLLVNRYAFAVDTGSNNGYDYADLFAADGEFMRPYARGREQLAALARGGKLGPANTVHYIMNHVIEPAPGGAVGRQYLVELNFDIPRAPAAPGQGRGGQIDQWAQIGRKNGELARTGGHYEDIYVKTEDGWRFRKRDFIPSRSGVEPAPLPPPRIPADAGQQTFPPAPPARFTPPTRQTTLTAMDYVEIQQLVSSYGHALDSGYGTGENGEPYAKLYTPDAAFAGASGHDQLVVLAHEQPRGPDYVRHYLTNHVIEPTPEGVKGKEYLIVIDNGENGKGSSIYLGGHYEETYEKTSEGWRFKTRRLITPRSGAQP